MSLDPRTRAGLEQLGVSVVRQILEQRSGPGRGSLVKLGITGVPDPDCGDVEDWIAERDRAATNLTNTQHRQLLRWGRTAGIGAICAVIIGLVSIWQSAHPSGPSDVNEQLAACGRSAYRAFPGQDPASNIAEARDIELCMQAAGYRFDTAPKTCNATSLVEGPETQAACYRRVTWLDRVLKR